jgi:hypothetical protein
MIELREEVELKRKQSGYPDYQKKNVMTYGFFFGSFLGPP